LIGEALDRCPICAQLAWECDHAIFDYMSSEEAFGDLCQLRKEFLQAVAAIRELFASCRKKGIKPCDSELAKCFVLAPETWDEDEGEPDRTDIVLDFIKGLPTVQVTESGGQIQFWSDDVEFVRSRLRTWTVQIEVDASRDA
jgi:hypothetical protein